MAVPPLIETLVEHISPPGFALVAIIANVFPAIPEEVFLLSFGYLAHSSPANFPFIEITLFLILGFLIVDSVLYYLTLRGSKIVHFLSKRVLDIDLEQKQDFLKKHVFKVIFVSRFLVQLRSIGPITAATVHYPYKKFLYADFLALVIYTPLLMGIGYYFANRLSKILSGAHVISNIMLTVLGILFLVIILRKARKILLHRLRKN